MLTILNDLHIGVNRTAGTTLASSAALKQHLRDKFAALLPEQGDVMILGDLFDTGNVPISEVFSTYVILDDWLRNHNGHVYNVRGNHDVTKTSNIMSSFDFLGMLLKRNHPYKYTHITESCLTPWGYVIPHYPNQDLFDLEIDRAIDTYSGGNIYLHCNYDNGFASQSDQSLNLSREQADRLNVEHVILGHEHHPRKSGKVLIPGNQVASSVSDWLQSDDKQCIVVSDNGSVTFEKTAFKKDEFLEVPYTELEFTDHKFIRVIGKIAATEHSKLVTVLNRFRLKSDAFVITNAVEAVSEDTKAIVAQSLESVKAFSVWDSLVEILTADEIKILESVNAD